jgi:Iap family predicted aminopeptidase
MTDASREASLATAGALPLDADRMLATVNRLAAIGSTPLGCRLTGTPEDHHAAESVADALAGAGLTEVALEPIEVDAWRFVGADLTVGGQTFPAVSWSGVPATPSGGITGPLTDLGTPTRRGLDGAELSGHVVLADLRSSPAGAAELALELSLRGAAALVFSYGRRGPFFQAEDAYGAMPGRWYAGAVPMVLVSKETVAALRSQRAGAPVEACVRLEASQSPRSVGWNVSGCLDGDEPGPIVVSAHHDAWFRGAWDNASGVAVLVELARALAQAGVRPRHRICFTSTTGEECGMRDTFVDGLIGSWSLVSKTHPKWADDAPFHLCIEAIGRPGAPVRFEAPLELADWTRRLARSAARRGWLPDGWRSGEAGATTDLWPLLVSGIPGVAAFNWSDRLQRQDYHTPLDTPAVLDGARLVGAARLCALLVLEADRDPDGALDHEARAQDLRRVARELDDGSALARAAARHARVEGRAAFGPIGRGMFALVMREIDGGYPHLQAQRDARALGRALQAWSVGDRAATIAQLECVGGNRAGRVLSAEVLERQAARWDPDADRLAWAARSHLTRSPVLRSELATLRDEPGARPPGPWLMASLERHLAAARAEVERRVRGMEKALAEAAG